MLTVGRTVAEAYARLYMVHKAARTQVAAATMAAAARGATGDAPGAAARGGLHFPPAAVQAFTRAKQGLNFPATEAEGVALTGFTDALFAWAVRRVDKANPGYDQ